MKKLLAFLTVICLCTALFAACGNTTPPETTPSSTLPPEGTTGSSETTPAETTKPAETTIASSDPQVFDSAEYDFAVRTIEDDYGKVLGVAAFSWKGAAENITFTSEYKVDGKTYSVLKIGVGIGVLNFQSRLKSITVPEGIVEIADNAFTFCYALTDLKLPEGLEKIGTMAFWNCNMLETLVIPSTVTEIGENAFADCSSLKSVTLPRIFEGKTDTIFVGCKNATFTFVD